MSFFFVMARYATAQVQYIEESAASGIGEYTMQRGDGGGVAAADFDDDGDIDLFLPNEQDVPDQLYRNLGNGQFEEIGGQAGVASLNAARTALWFDYDGDHRLDLLVAGDCYTLSGPCAEESVLTLYRQFAPGLFSDVTVASGIAGESVTLNATAHRGGMAAGDINNDGYLDVVIGMWRGKSRLLLNNTDGTFTDISSAIETGDTVVYDWQHMMHDFDGDGLLDLFAAVDNLPNRLWINQGDNSFVDEAVEAQVDTSMNEMGISLGDYDNDGDFDIYVTNIQIGTRHNVLFRNDSTPESLIFEEVSQDLDVDRTGWGWGCIFFDADNDGLLDLAATNGWYSDENATDSSRLYRNFGGDPEWFQDVSASVNFDDTMWGSSLIALDYDRDGHLDLVQTIHPLDGQVSLLRLLHSVPDSETESNRFIVIKPRIPGPNNRAIGAVVRVEAGSLSMSRLISAGTSFLGQEPAEAHFGLGNSTSADVVVEWPDGSESEFLGLDANLNYVVDKTTAYATNGDSDGDGLFDFDEVDLYGTLPAEPDTDGDGISDGHEVTFGSDPLDPEDFVALKGPGPLKSVSVLLFAAALVATFQRRRYGNG